jgi:hypothetical protein
VIVGDTIAIMVRKSEWVSSFADYNGEVLDSGIIIIIYIITIIPIILTFFIIIILPSSPVHPNYYSYLGVASTV